MAARGTPMRARAMLEWWCALARGMRWGLVGVLLLLLLGMVACQRKQGRAAAEARVAAAQGEAASASGREAVEIVSRHAQQTQEELALTRANREEIEDAEGANEMVADGVHDAGIDGLCRRAAYRERERCRLRGAGAR